MIVTNDIKLGLLLTDSFDRKQTILLTGDFQHHCFCSAFCFIVCSADKLQLTTSAQLAESLLVSPDIQNSFCV